MAHISTKYFFQSDKETISLVVFILKYRIKQESFQLMLDAYSMKQNSVET